MDDEGVMPYRPRSKPIVTQEQCVSVEELLRTRASNGEVCNEQPTLGTFSGDQGSSDCIAAAEAQQHILLAGCPAQVTAVADHCKWTDREKGEEEKEAENKEEEKEDIADQDSEEADQRDEVTEATKQCDFTV